MKCFCVRAVATGKGKTERENQREGILLRSLLSPALSRAGDLLMGTGPRWGLSPGKGFVWIACLISKENVGIVVLLDPELEERQKIPFSEVEPMVRQCRRLVGLWGERWCFGLS